MVKTSVQATLSGSTLSFEETGVRSNQRAASWCLVAGSFGIGNERFSGTWQTDGCGGGSANGFDRGPEWYDQLPWCPCEITDELDGEVAGDGVWRTSSTDRKWLTSFFHPGACREARWGPDGGGPGQQCTYDEDDKLITSGLGAGSADVFSPIDARETLKHFARDVVPLGFIDCATYFEWFPPNNRNACPDNPSTPIDDEDQSCLGTLFDRLLAALLSGDPHLVTFDGLRYDMQAVGELVAARSVDDDFEVQIRTAPWGDSTFVSVNTAVAARVAGARVALYRQGSSGGLDVWVDGEFVEVATELALNGGGSVRRTGGTVTVEWPDGSTVRARADRNFVNVGLTLVPARYGRIEGLLGNANGNAFDDLQTDADVPFGTESPFRSFYQDYVMSWRVSDATSLFDYGEDETTATYTDLLFPWRPFRASDLPVDDYEAARATCLAAGIREGSGQLEDCILDVGLTGEDDATDASDHPLDAQATVTLNAPADLEPQAILVAPEAGEELRPDVPIDFEARVADDLTPVDELVLGFVSDLDGTLPMTLDVDARGGVTGSAELSVGVHQLTFFVEDAGGQRTTTSAVSVTVARELPDCAEQLTLDIEASCADISSSVSGIYALDPDGIGQGEDPICTRCEMTLQGGGWTMFAHHADGLVERVATSSLSLSELGVVPAAHWVALRDGMTDGMLFLDENGALSLLSETKLQAGNCGTPDDTDDLAGDQWLRLWHDETSGCAVTGLDYSLVVLGSDALPQGSFAGASVYNQSLTKFDVWGYGTSALSYPSQDTLYYYIK